MGASRSPIPAHIGGVSAPEPRKKQMVLHSADVSEGVPQNAASSDVNAGGPERPMGTAYWEGLWRNGWSWRS